MATKRFNIATDTTGYTNVYFPASQETVITAISLYDTTSATLPTANEDFEIVLIKWSATKQFGVFVDSVNQEKRSLKRPINLKKGEQLSLAIQTTAASTKMFVGIEFFTKEDKETENNEDLIKW